MPGRNEPQHGLAPADDERVARVVAALEPDDALRVLGQPVDDLALTFIAPLGADDDDVLAHGSLPEWWRGIGDARGAIQERVVVPGSPASCRRSSVNPVAGRARPNALPMPS